MSEFKTGTKKGPHERFVEHKSGAERRGIPFLLTFEDWWKMWESSGRWNERGNRRHQYVMARFGDKGGYELGNVRICTAAENRAEQVIKGNEWDADFLARYTKESDWAKAHGITQRTVFRYRQRGLPFMFFGGWVWIPRQEGDEWIAARVKRRNASRRRTAAL
jgi:hypothetical protein